MFYVATNRLLLEYLTMVVERNAKARGVDWCFSLLTCIVEFESKLSMLEAILPARTVKDLTTNSTHCFIISTLYTHLEEKKYPSHGGVFEELSLNYFFFAAVFFFA